MTHVKRLTRVAAIVAIAACSKQGSNDPTKAEAKVETKDAKEAKEAKADAKVDAKVEAKIAAADDPCSAAALRLGTATQSPPFEPPSSCTYKEGPTWIGSDDEARAALGCDGKALGVDFKSDAIYVATGQLSPAQTGSYPFDDGKTVTLVSRFRDPCPDDPRPMPTPYTYMFKMPAGARTFATAQCTTKSKCR